MGKRWTKQEERALLQGVGTYGLAWFQKKTGNSHDWPNAPKGRSRDAIKAKSRRIYGQGGLTRGSYTLREACEQTGYVITQIKRAGAALRQHWKRTSPRGSFLIYEEQLEEIIQWLKVDYWSKKHRLYNCLECGTDSREHHRFGLCKRCYDRYSKRLCRNGFPFQVSKLLSWVRRWKNKEPSQALEQAELLLSRGRALTMDLVIQILRLEPHAKY